jgi:hypothetical protein
MEILELSEENNQLRARLAVAEANLREMCQAVEYFGKNLPEWLIKTEPGLCATMYKTGTYKGDCKVVDAIQGRIAKARAIMVALDE